MKNTATKTFIFLMFFSAVWTVFSENHSSASGKNAGKEPPYTADMVEANIANIKKIMFVGNDGDADKPVKAMQLLGFAGCFEFFSKYEKIEKLTNVSREWYKKLHDLLLVMYQPRSKMDTALLNRDKNIYDSEKIKYEKELKLFKELIENPEKVKAKKN